MIDNLTRMEPVPVTDVWRREDRHFTPWLADHIDFLADSLALDLEVTGTEVRTPEGRRADIVARCDGKTAVIENQLGPSDDNHFVRLLYYASCLNAKVLIWIATSFKPEHRKNMEWISKAKEVDAYCVELSTWLLGNSTAPMLRPIVPFDVMDPSTIEAFKYGRRYRDFYRPLLDRLKEAGFDHTEDPGWPTNANFRWFTTPYQNIHYGLVHADEGDGKTHAFLLLNSSDPDPRLMQLQDDFGDSSAHSFEWHSDEESWVSLSTDASDTDLANPEGTRDWMFANLMLLRETLAPHLENLLAHQ